jgi:hypothetical protein
VVDLEIDRSSWIAAVVSALSGTSKIDMFYVGFRRSCVQVHPRLRERDIPARRRGSLAKMYSNPYVREASATRSILIDFGILLLGLAHPTEQFFVPHLDKCGVDLLPVFCKIRRINF